MSGKTFKRVKVIHNHAIIDCSKKKTFNSKLPETYAFNVLELSIKVLSRWYFSRLSLMMLERPQKQMVLFTTPIKEAAHHITFRKNVSQSPERFLNLINNHIRSEGNLHKGRDVHRAMCVYLLPIKPLAKENFILSDFIIERNNKICRLRKFIHLESLYLPE